ncbi:MAG: hypothetical protein MSA78_03330 [Solobacterium sp.]|nr:hypothetical protein [Solobacterium sp.]
MSINSEDELLLNNARELERYLSSGTIKGIITFTMMQETLKLVLICL